MTDEIDKRLGADCFFCYANDGGTYAWALSSALGKLGVSCFLPVDVSPQGLWEGHHRNAMQQARTVVLVGSPGAFRSDSVLFQLEFFHRKLKQYILPIIFDSVERIDLEALLWLRNIAWLREDRSRLRQGPSDATIARLIKALRQVLDSPQGDATTESGPPVLEPRSERPLNEGKLILVGRGEVGKTSVVNGLVHDTFRGDEEKTQGINITRWTVRSGATKVRLHIWDFGGQEIMHATHQFFLTERSLYLLVLNGREGGEDADADYWLKHIEAFGGESPVIIVQNKIAQHPFDLNYRGLKASYPQIRAFVKTDCRHTIGFVQLRESIRDALGEMPEIRTLFPRDWFAVKRRLESTNEDFIGYDTFQRLCSQHGVENDADRQMLSWVLHCLGVALNYRDDWRLRETSVLKPEWVTHGIYQILNAKRVADRQGELHISDLEQILPRDKYPQGKYLFLLDLMRKFSLCLPFLEEEDRYLIPELLGKEEPIEAQQYVPGDCLNFEYHYAILPEGLIPRFIVRSHTLSRNQQRWRSGAILAHEGSQGLVKAEPGERRVVVRIRGQDAETRRRLLAIIRYDFDRIHGEFKDRLDVHSKVPLPTHPNFSVDYAKLLAFEKRGVKEFPEFVGDEVVSVQVNELLNGVDLEAQRQDPLTTIARAKSIFFSYSHEDEDMRDELETHLKLLQREGLVSVWHDRKLAAGSHRNREIDIHLQRADVILILASADLIASDYCWNIEVKRAMQRHVLGEAVVIPVILRECEWRRTPFGELQALPLTGQPVATWTDRDAAWMEVIRGLRTIVRSDGANHPV